ncbi:hypothetical protein E2C01_101155 [Portunus trituberculatus]|uniref:Uncharacterized protein n=1 Tax=Portunus trituberculatus TaxID=210409 RepID=A0A5B7KL93_PORTR|nr:hypothetical protein [Portunus trituberculatus]
MERGGANEPLNGGDERSPPPPPLPRHTPLPDTATADTRHCPATARKRGRRGVSRQLTVYYCKVLIKVPIQKNSEILSP